MIAGRGVRGSVAERLVTVGSHRLFDEQHTHSQEFCDQISAAEAQGQTVMLLGEDGRVRGFISVADAVRPESRRVVEDLEAMGLTTALLTGDNATVAQAVGKAVGVEVVLAGLLPEDKVAAVHDLLARYSQAAMVGDGINDAPALATATVGIAMGGAGSAQAMETADVVLIGDELGRLPFAIHVARLARRLITQNVGLSLGMKLIFVLLALTGDASLWMAILADMGMSLLVTLNGMRPLRLRG
jgi:Cd2+/Zn2+-exporting ATPase